MSGLAWLPLNVQMIVIAIYLTRADPSSDIEGAMLIQSAVK